jgi:hypothetical protein
MRAGTPARTRLLPPAVAPLAVTPTGAFILFLRLYQPRRSVLGGSWPLPTITRVG